MPVFRRPPVRVEVFVEMGLTTVTLQNNEAPCGSRLLPPDDEDDA